MSYILSLFRKILGYSKWLYKFKLTIQQRFNATYHLIFIIACDVCLNIVYLNLRNKLQVVQHKIVFNINHCCTKRDKCLQGTWHQTWATETNNTTVWDTTAPTTGCSVSSSVQKSGWSSAWTVWLGWSFLQWEGQTCTNN